MVVWPGHMAVWPGHMALILRFPLGPRGACYVNAMRLCVQFGEVKHAMFTRVVHLGASNRFSLLFTLFT